MFAEKVPRGITLYCFFRWVAGRLSVQQQGDEGLISYADLEKIPHKIDNQLLDQHYDTLEMSPDMFDDLSQDKTFEDIPSDVFDKIPRAVTAREEKRLIKLQEKLMMENRKEKDSSQNTQDFDGETQVSFSKLQKYFLVKPF